MSSPSRGGAEANAHEHPLTPEAPSGPPWDGALKFSVNISMLFLELPLLDRPAAVAQNGFSAIECWWPFARAVPSGAEADAFVSAVLSANVDLVCLNCFAGDRDRGDRGITTLPEREEEFRESIRVLLHIAERTGCKRFNVPYGHYVEGCSRVVHDETALRNLAFVGRAVRPLGGTVLVEPLTWGDNGPYPLRTSKDVLAIVDQLGDQNLDNFKLLADVYHLASNGDDPVAVLRQHLDRVGHVQIADTPGRNQPGTGRLNFAEVFSALADGCYDGYVGLEYHPLGRTIDSFGWVTPPRPRRLVVGSTSPCFVRGAVRC